MATHRVYVKRDSPRQNGGFDAANCRDRSDVHWASITTTYGLHYASVPVHPHARKHTRQPPFSGPAAVHRISTAVRSARRLRRAVIAIRRNRTTRLLFSTGVNITLTKSVDQWEQLMKESISSLATDDVGFVAIGFRFLRISSRSTFLPNSSSPRE